MTSEPVQPVEQQPRGMATAICRTRWSLLTPYLERGLELTADARAAWLNGLRREDPTLATDLEVLFADCRTLREEGFLQSRPTTAKPSGLLVDRHGVEQPLGIAARLRLVLLALRAVAHALANLVRPPRRRAS